MFLSKVLRRMRPRAVPSRGSSGNVRSRRSRARPLVLEALEDRCLPTSYGFTLIADNGPHSIFTLGALNQPGLNDEGTVMFHSALKSGAVGVFTIDRAGSLRTIALTGDRASAFPLGGGITDDGTVSFGANLVAGGQAIFTGKGKELSRIADTGADIPFSICHPATAHTNNHEAVAVRATLKAGGTVLFTNSAGEGPRSPSVTVCHSRATVLPTLQRT